MEKKYEISIYMVEFNISLIENVYNIMSRIRHLRQIMLKYILPFPNLGIRSLLPPCELQECATIVME